MRVVHTPVRGNYLLGRLMSINIVPRNDLIETLLDYQLYVAPLQAGELRSSPVPALTGYRNR